MTVGSYADDAGASRPFSSPKIAVLPGVTVCGPEPREKVIKLIEDLLDEAKSGQIQTFAAIMIDNDGNVSNAVAAGGQFHAHHLVAGCVYLMRHVEEKVGLG